MESQKQSRPLPRAGGGKNLFYFLAGQGRMTSVNHSLFVEAGMATVPSAGQESHPTPSVGTLSKTKKSAMNYHIKSNKERRQRLSSCFVDSWLRANRALTMNISGGTAIATILSISQCG